MKRQKKKKVEDRPVLIRSESLRLHQLKNLVVTNLRRSFYRQAANQNTKRSGNGLVDMAIAGRNGNGRKVPEFGLVPR